MTTLSLHAETKGRFHSVRVLEFTENAYWEHLIDDMDMPDDWDYTEFHFEVFHLVTLHFLEEDLILDFYIPTWDLSDPNLQYWENIGGTYQIEIGNDEWQMILDSDKNDFFYSTVIGRVK